MPSARSKPRAVATMSGQYTGLCEVSAITMRSSGPAAATAVGGALPACGALVGAVPALLGGAAGALVGRLPPAVGLGAVVVEGAAQLNNRRASSTAARWIMGFPPSRTRLQRTPG